LARLIEFTNKGLYCSIGDFYIDPWQKVDKALITHAHSDHARWGMGFYFAQIDNIPILKHRLGSDIQISGVSYDEKLRINGVNVSFHPAGHIIGSSQIRVEYQGEVWVISGDYKIENDGISEVFEPIKCHHFVTESTFGLPVFKWRHDQEVFNEINTWWAYNQQKKTNTVITCYSLGKAQRIIQGLDFNLGKVFAHAAIYNMQQVICDYVKPLKRVERMEANTDKSNLKSSLILVPPGASGSSWMKKLEPYVLGVASGWMSLRGTRRRYAADRGFVLSDHADFNGLLRAIDATQAENIYVTHGYSHVLAQYLSNKGLHAQVVKTAYEGENIDVSNETLIEI
jgi:putative mRNA 3-end processing factor